jgi:hypothetical protein
MVILQIELLKQRSLNIFPMKLKCDLDFNTVYATN